jgi:SNF2 family DNA or RNA helicase
VGSFLRSLRWYGKVAEDRFRADDSVKLFISSDRGSDSINLEHAVTVINYDLPYKYSTLLQRVNRINRITSTADHVWYYNFIMAHSMEERKKEILDIKKGMHEAVEDPSIEHSEAITGLTKQDYLFILTGKHS